MGKKDYDYTKKPKINFADFLSTDASYLKDVPGIYLYVNKNGNKYVGQSTDLRKRLREHKATADREDPQYLEPIDSAIKQYGAENFDIFILENIPNADKSRLNKAEIEWISALDTYKNHNDYNITPGGDLNIVHRRQSIFWVDDETHDYGGYLDKKKLNKVREYIQKSNKTIDEKRNDLAKPLIDPDKESEVQQLMSDTTFRKINECSGMYKLNYYEKTKKGFTDPLNAENTRYGRNQHDNKGQLNYYVFDISTDEEDLIPENAINKEPFLDWKQVSDFINGDTRDRLQISRISRGLSKDGSANPKNPYVYSDKYKIKSFRIKTSKNLI